MLSGNNSTKSISVIFAIFAIFILCIAPVSGSWYFYNMQTDDVCDAIGRADSGVYHTTYQYESGSWYTVAPVTKSAFKFTDNIMQGYTTPMIAYLDDENQVDYYGDTSRTTYCMRGTDPEAPIAGFTASKRSGLSPLTGTLTDISTGGSPPTSWMWEISLNDQVVANSTARNMTFNLTENGNYDVRLQVENEYGQDTLIQENFLKVGWVYIYLELSDYRSGELVPNATISIQNTTTGVWSEIDAHSGSVFFDSTDAAGLEVLTVGQVVNLRAIHPNYPRTGYSTYKYTGNITVEAEKKFFIVFIPDYYFSATLYDSQSHSVTGPTNAQLKIGSGVWDNMTGQTWKTGFERGTKLNGQAFLSLIHISEPTRPY